MKKIIAFVCIIVAMLIWGTSFLVMKNALNSMCSSLVILLRSSLAFLFLLPFSIKHFKQLTKNEVVLIIFSGFFVAMGYLFQAVGLNYTTPGKSSLLENSYCIIVPILFCVITKKKPPIINVICIVICIIGVIIVSYESLTQGDFIGDFLSLIAGFAFGVNIVLTGLYAKKTHPLTYTCGQFFITTIVSGMYFLLVDFENQVTINLESVAQILYLGVVSTALAWALRNKAQKVLSPITVSIILPFTGVVSTFISILTKQDTLTIFLIIGGILILSSILINTLFENKKESATNPIQ